MATSDGPCPGCGKPYPPGSTLCPACGRRLVPLGSRLPPQRNVPTSATIRDEKKSVLDGLPDISPAVWKVTAIVTLFVLFVGAKWLFNPVRLTSQARYKPPPGATYTWNLPKLVYEPMYSLRRGLGRTARRGRTDGGLRYLMYKRGDATLTVYYTGNDVAHLKLTATSPPGDKRAHLMEVGNLKDDNALCIVEYFDAAGNAVAADAAPAGSGAPAVEVHSLIVRRRTAEG